jgi:hypothetical protein
MPFQCEECGKFCRPVDSGTYWGGTLDLDPPEPVYFCAKCVDRLLQTPETIIIACWWVKPNYVIRAERYDQ